MNFSSRLLPLLFLFLGLVLASPAHLAAQENPLAGRLVGTWAETGGKDSLVSLNKDGTFKLYLKKGEVEDKQSLEGTWKVTPDGRFSVNLDLAGKKEEVSAQAKFEGEVMILVDDDGRETRHQRHEGPIPERFNW